MSLLVDFSLYFFGIIVYRLILSFIFCEQCEIINLILNLNKRCGSGLELYLLEKLVVRY